MRNLLVFMLLFMFASSALAAGGEAVLGWDANTEPDLAGYKVYFGTVSKEYGPGIDVGLTATPATPSHVITFPNDGMYFFAVSAYDQSGNESLLSDEVSKIIDSTPPARPNRLQVLIRKILAFLGRLFGG